MDRAQTVSATDSTPHAQVIARTALAAASIATGRSRAHEQDPFAGGSRLPVVLVGSLLLHGVAAAALTALPAADLLVATIAPTTVSFEVELPPEPVAPVLPPPPPEQPAAIIPPVERQRETPRERPQPTPEPEVARPEAPPAQPEAPPPPSIDDVFAEPPPSLPIMAAEGGSGIAMGAGDPNGVAGGQAGGRGTTLGGRVGAGSGSSEQVATGPTEAERRRARREYVREIERMLREHARYPRAAQRDHVEGRVELALRISPQGSLLAVRVAESSGSTVLDEAAVDTLRDLGSLPTPPQFAWRPGDEVHAGVDYRLR